jgi:hypothetical protein
MLSLVLLTLCSLMRRQARRFAWPHHASRSRPSPASRYSHPRHGVGVVLYFPTPASPHPLQLCQGRQGIVLYVPCLAPDGPRTLQLSTQLGEANHHLHELDDPALMIRSDLADKIKM